MQNIHSIQDRNFFQVFIFYRIFSIRYVSQIFTSFLYVTQIYPFPTQLSGKR